MKKILIATGLFPPESGGPATYSKMLAEELPKRGFEVDVLPFSSVRHLPKVVRHLAYARTLRARAASASVIYAQDPVSVGLPAALVALFVRKPFFLRVPGDFAWEQGVQRFGVTASLDEFQTHRHGGLPGLMCWLQRQVARRARAVVVPSAYLKRIVEGWGVPASRIHVIYSSIELPVPAETPKERPQGFLVATVGRLVPWKGVRELIEVVAQERGWRLVVVGDGPQRADLERLAEHLKLKDRVHFTGALPRAQALGWVKAADVLALNSSYEGLSHLLVETIALGTPIVATDAGGNPELIETGQTGLLVPVGDTEALRAALARVASSPEEAAARAAAAQKKLPTFTAEVTLRQLTNLFENL